MQENAFVYNNFILAKRSNNHKVDCWKRSYYLQSMVLPNGQTCLETCLTSTDALIRNIKICMIDLKRLGKAPLYFSD